MTPDITRILVGVDFSSNSDRALDYAGMLARRFGASLHLVHVLEPLSLGSPALDAAAFTRPDWNRLLAEDAQQELTKRAAPFQPFVATTSVLYGDPAACLVRDADDRQMDLIVVGTHGRGAIAGIVMGSVAKHVVRSARCPVMTVREPAQTERVKVTRAPGMLVATAAAWVMVVAVFGGGVAFAQTANEQERIVRNFQQAVADYSSGSEPSQVFTLPVAAVFRQLIAKALVNRPIPAATPAEFPRELQEVLPELPCPLEYQLIEDDLLLRDRDTGVIVGILRDALATARVARQ